jgi:uncharacterized protein (DUF1697 family)
VRTYIQSGNVVFSAGEGSARQLTARVAAAIRTVGFDVPVVLRAAGDLGAPLENNPYLQEGAEPGSVVFSRRVSLGAERR